MSGGAKIEPFRDGLALPLNVRMAIYTIHQRMFGGEPDAAFFLGAAQNFTSEELYRLEAILYTRRGPRLVL